MGSSSKGGSVTVGYWYKMNVQAVICHGPVDSVKKFIVGERLAWSGDVTSNTSISVNQPELFGGESREGGVDGYIDVMFGESDQSVNDLLALKREYPPAYRGLLTVLFRSAFSLPIFGSLHLRVNAKGNEGFTWSAMNPYIKPFWFTVKHIIKGRSWYTSKAAIGEDMNPIHIIYDVLSNTNYALGFGTNRIDDAAFRAAADQCYSEGFGLSLVWQGSTTAWEFIQTVLDHINGILYVDPVTGLFTIRLAREDYDVSTLTSLDPSNIVAFHSFDRAAWGEITNQVVVNYTNPETESSASVTVQNPAAVGSQGGRILSTEINVPGIRSSALALRVGMRTLRSISSPLAKVSLEVNRVGYNLRPGDVIKLNWPPLGITAMPMRVGEVDYGTLTDGKIKVEAVEDVFGMPSTVYAGSETGGWSDPVVAPEPITVQRVMEASFYEVNRSLAPSIIADFDPAFGFGKVLAVRPHSSMISYQIVASSTSGGTYNSVASGEFVPTATLATAINQTDTGFALNNIDGLSDVPLNSYGYIEDEAVEYLGYDTGAGVYRFNRGVIDTVPMAHAIGARLYFDVDAVAVDQTERLSGETVYYKPLPRNGLGTLPVALAGYSALTLAQRYQRPYPPGNFKINGSSYPSSVTAGPLTITWAHRDRTQQTAGLTQQSAGNIGPEAGTTYNVRIYNATSGTLLQNTNVSGTTYTYSADYTKVLLHFDGDDNSTTIVDEKGHAFTAFGNAKLSIANKKFGPTALLLDGTGDYIRASTSTDFDFQASGFQVEAWVMRTATKLQNIATNRNTSGSTTGWSFSITAANQLNLTVWNTSSGTYFTVTSTATVAINTITHVAASFDGTTARLFIDGALAGSTSTLSGTPTTSAQPFYIGRDPYDTALDFSGMIDEFRLIKGNPTYLAAFTPPSYQYGLDVMPSDVRVEVESLRDGLTSWQKQTATVALITADRITEDGVTRITEDGGSRKLEQ